MSIVIDEAKMSSIKFKILANDGRKTNDKKQLPVTFTCEVIFQMLFLIGLYFIKMDKVSC